MAKLKKSVQLQDLSRYRVWITDESPSSTYFRVKQVPDVLTAGKNAFLIDGSEYLTGEVLVEIVDSEGNPVFVQPIRNYLEGLSRLVSIEVYEDTPRGPATLTIMGRLTQDENGNVPPDEFRGVYNVRWQKSISIAPEKTNTTPIRLYRRPLISVVERLVPYREPATPVATTISTGSVVLSTYQSSPGVPDTRFVQLSILNNPFQFNRDMVDGEFRAMVNGTSYTSSISEVVNSKILRLEESITLSTGRPEIELTDWELEYTPSVAFTSTFLSRSFADITLSRLTTFAGDIQRAKVYARSLDVDKQYQLVIDTALESRFLTTTQSLETGDLNVRMGYPTSQAQVSAYWNGGTILNSSAYVVDAGAGVAYSSTELLDGIHLASGSLHTSSTTPRYFFGLTKSFDFTEELEYSLTAKVACAKQNASVAARMDVYLYGTAFPETAESPLGVRIATYSVPAGVSRRSFGTQVVNFAAPADGEAQLRFVIYSGDWTVSEVELTSARETGFNPDEVNLVVPINNRRLEKLQFKAELLDANSNLVPISIESDSVFFDGGNFVVKGTDNQLDGKLVVGSDPVGGIVFTTEGYTGSFGPLPDVPAIYIGRGEYSSSNTPFIVASGSQGTVMSLGNKFLWDGETLTIVGAIRQRLPEQGGGIVNDYVHRGEWASGVAYYSFDLVGYSGSTYSVVTNHTSTPLSHPLNSGSLFTVFAQGGGSGTPGANAQLVKLGASGQIFTFDPNGSPDPASQTISFTASLQNIAGDPVWSTSPSVGLGNNGMYASMSVANFGANNSVRVVATAGAYSDSITVYRLTAGQSGSEGPAGLTAFLTNEAHTVGASSTGEVSDLTGAETVMKLYRGVVDVTDDFSISKSDSGVSSSLSGSGTTTPTVTITAFPTNVDTGYVDITATSGSLSLIRRFSLSKSKTGADGSTGPDGPGIVYRGPYNAGTTYYKTVDRRDVVEYAGAYYITANAAKSGLASWGTPTGGDWEAFGAQFSSVATDILLAQNASITKGLVFGDQAGNVGFLRSANASVSGGVGFYADGSGSLYIGSGSTSTGRGNWMKFDRTNLEIRANQFKMYATNLKIDSALSGSGLITLGSATSFTSGKGIYMDGNGRFRAGDPAGSQMYFSGSTLVIDSLDNVNDGTTYGRPRGETLVNGIPLAHCQIETFTNENIDLRWVTKTSGSNATATVVTGSSDSTYGGKVYQGSGYIWWEGRHNIPFDPDRLYMMKIRFRQKTALSSGDDTIYVGLAGVGEDGVTYVNAEGDDDYGSQHYFVASGYNPSVGTDWIELTGFVHGYGATTGSYFSTHPSSSNPAKMHPDVRFIRPLFVHGFNNGAGGAFEVDYILYPALANTATDEQLNVAQRSINSILYQDGVLASSVKILESNGGTNSIEIVKGLQHNIQTRATCQDGEPVTFDVPFQNTPFVWVAGGMALATGSSWIGGSYNSAKPVFDDTYALDVTTTGFTPYAKLFQKTIVTTTKTANFTSGNVADADGDYTAPVSIPAGGGAYNNQYTIRFREVLECTSKNFSNWARATSHWTIQSNDGSGWVDRVSGGSNAYSEGPTATVTTDHARTITVSGMGTGDQFRVRHDGITIQSSVGGTADMTLSGNTGANNNGQAGLTYLSGSGAQVTATKTPDDDDLLFYFAMTV